MCEEIFETLSIDKDVFVESQARYSADESAAEELTDAMQTGKVSKETLQQNKALAQSMQLNISTVGPARPMKKEEVRQALDKTRDGYVRQRTQSTLQASKKTRTGPASTIEEVIAELVLKARANDEHFMEHSVSEEDIDDAVLYYNLVLGESLSMGSH